MIYAIAKAKNYDYAVILMKYTFSALFSFAFESFDDR